MNRVVDNLVLCREQGADIASFTKKRLAVEMRIVQMLIELDLSPKIFSSFLNRTSVADRPTSTSNPPASVTQPG